MDYKSQIIPLIAELVELRRESWKLSNDEERDTEELGPPATWGEISSVERVLGRPLPPSYRAFLELHNGWGRFSADARILSASDRSEPWVQKTLGNLSDLFDEFEEQNPLKNGAFAIMLGKTSPMSILLDATTVRPDGEQDFVLFEWTEEQARFPDFVSFLSYDLKNEKHYVETQKHGSPDGDEGDED